MGLTGGGSLKCRFARPLKPFSRNFPSELTLFCPRLHWKTTLAQSDDLVLNVCAMENNDVVLPTAFASTTQKPRAQLFSGIHCQT